MIIDLICGLDEIGLLEKGGDDGEWMMWGFASTPARDREDESVIQKGLNVSPMLSHGWVNWDHDRRQLIGVPTVADVRPHPRTKSEGLYVEYRLVKGFPMAKTVYQMAKALRDENIPRELGLSLEGQRKRVSKRGKVEAADIYGMAVTPYAMNPETSTTVLAKSILFPNADDLPSADIFLPETIRLIKAMETGGDVGGTTQQSSGSMRSENVDGGPLGYRMFDAVAFSKYMSRLPPNFQKAYRELEEIAKSRGGKITKGEAIALFSLCGFGLDAILEALE